MYKKEIRRVEVGFNEKKMIPTRTFLFFYWKQIADFFFFFFRILQRISLQFIYNQCILKYRKKAQIKGKRMYGYHFFMPNYTFLISFPGRQMTKARDFNFFLFLFIGKLIKFFTDI